MRRFNPPSAVAASAIRTSFSGAVAFGAGALMGAIAAPDDHNYQGREAIGALVGAATGFVGYGMFKAAHFFMGDNDTQNNQKPKP